MSDLTSSHLPLAPFSPHKLLKRIEDAWPSAASRDSKSILAVSGGPDSMFLLEVCLRLFKAPENLTVVHCNHQLRGDESDQDEAFVRAQCERRGIDVRVFRFDLEQSARSDEEHLRKHRHECLRKAARECDARSIIFGHHLDDNLETFFHRLLRGTGTRGLCGIASSREYVDKHDGKTRVLLRPFLQVSKAEIYDWLLAEGVPYRIDSSNCSTRYTRNRLRLELFPMLDNLSGPSWRERVASTMEQFKELATEDAELARRVIADPHVEWIEFDSMTVPLSMLTSLRWPVLREFFVEVWHRLELPLREMSSAHWRRVREFLVKAADTRDPKRHQTAGGVMLQTKKGLLTVRRHIVGE